MYWTLAASLAFGLSGDLPPPEPEAVLRLPGAIVEQLDEQIVRRSRSAEGRLNLLVDFMFSARGLNFSYIVEPTRDAAKTLETRQGNCLSFTLLFLAMADHVGIPAQAREVQVPISWRRDGSALYESGHVNVHVKTERRRAVVDFEPDPLLSHRLAVTQRGNPISRERVLAHFYNNRAGELLGQDLLEPARAWSQVALDLAPDFPAALNNRGVIEARLGQTEAALHYYQLALDINPDSSGTLFNLYELHRRNGQVREAGVVLDKLENLRSRDPYLHWSLARNFESLGELERADRLYRRAIRMKEDEPLFHVGLARIARATGDFDRAEEALLQALRLNRENPAMTLDWDHSLLALKLRMPEN